MPMPLGHSAIGFATHSVLSNGKSYIDRWKITLFIVILSNLPDIDVILGLIFQNNGSAFHRGPTHSILFAVIFGLIFSKFARLLSIQNMDFKFCFILILSHVVADHLLTSSPVSFLWPFEVYFSTGNAGWGQVLYTALFDAASDAAIVFICVFILMLNIVIRRTVQKSHSESQ